MTNSSADSQWLLSGGGPRYLKKMAGHLFDISLRDNSHQDIRAYTPWLSNADKQIEMGDLVGYLPVDRVCLDKDHLKKMSNFYGIGPEMEREIYIDVYPKDNHRAAYQKAMDLVSKSSDTLSEILTNLCFCIVPVLASKPFERKGGVGFSSHLAKGAIFLSLPARQKFDVIELSINLVHELGHQALMVYQMSDDIISPADFETPVYSGVRRCNRPAIQSFHALIALYFMRYFLRHLIRANFVLDEERSYAEKRLGEIKEAFSVSVQSFDKTVFTSFGAQLHQNCITEEQLS